MATIVQRRAPHAVRIALKTGPMSAWHYRSLTALGLPARADIQDRDDGVLVRAGQ
jgi:hypothetical protein